MTDKNIKVAVIGTGVMGSYHLKNYAKMEGVTLAGIYDIDLTRAAKVAEAFCTTAYDDLDKLMKEIDAASIVTPTSTHFSVAQKLLKAGIPCLIEKPLATTKKDCEELISIAKEHNTFFIVGHVERFNPAIMELTNLLQEKAAQVYKVTATRINQGSDRIKDVAVTSDLMIHDLDITLSLIDSPAHILKVEGDKDAATATLAFTNGSSAKLIASRKTNDRIRSLDLITSIGIFKIDYIAQTLTLNGNEIAITKGFSLESELNHFIACVHAQEKPKVTGEIALKALEVMWDIEKLLPL